jgi:2-oxoisovalerate dehydrogenase E2 component (dihydrolipoyl transacylase)
MTIEDVRGGTFTLNNTGALGSVWGGAIINHPQAAILTTEAIVKRPVVISSDGKDEVVVRSMMNICLSFDHRIIDGAEASEFLQAVKSGIEAIILESDLK